MYIRGCAGFPRLAKILACSRPRSRPHPLHSRRIYHRRMIPPGSSSESNIPVPFPFYLDVCVRARACASSLSQDYVVSSRRGTGITDGRFISLLIRNSVCVRARVSAPISDKGGISLHARQAASSRPSSGFA